MTKSVIALGLIGLSDFENDPLLQAIAVQQRFQLNAAFSSSYRKLSEFSQQLKLSPFGSCRKLAASNQVQGLIWYKDAVDVLPERIGLGKAAKHLLIRSDLLQRLPIDRLSHLQDHAVETQTEILPELRHRWTPATLRLRELVATQLGPIEKIHVHSNSSNSCCSTLFQTVDWLRMLLSLRSLTVLADRQNADQQNTVRLKFDRPHSKSVLCVIEVGATEADSSEKREASSSLVEQPESNTPHIRIDCEAGHVEFFSEIKLRWTTGSEAHEESLAGERSAEQVLLDLFGRRIVRGIVPVPDLMEVFRSQRVLAAVEASRCSNEVIHIDDHSLPIDDGKICF